MLTWIIQIIFISILFIFLVHHLILFLKNTLTTPKIKDLVTYSNKKYENIYSIINSSQSTDISKLNTNYANNFQDGSDIQSLPILSTNDIPSSSMKDELKNFLKSQLDDE